MTTPQVPQVPQPGEPPLRITIRTTVYGLGSIGRSIRADCRADAGVVLRLLTPLARLPEDWPPPGGEG